MPFAPSCSAKPKTYRKNSPRAQQSKRIARADTAFLHALFPEMKRTHE
jgi:hypothetical protein